MKKPTQLQKNNTEQNIHQTTNKEKFHHIKTRQHKSITLF